MSTTKIIPLALIMLVGVGIIRAHDDPYRLPTNYIVNHYDIDLTVPKESFTQNANNYSGSVVISFQVTVLTSEVKLHSSYSNIELLTVQLDSSTPLSAENYFVNSTTDILTLQFPSTLTVGQKYALKITFKAHLLGGGGFSKLSYTDHNNETQYVATTQFQATSARNAFPCFDEPTYKSTFAFRLTYPSDMNALTNTPSLKNTADAVTGLTTTQFLISPIMSVHLLAFTISKYTCSEGDLQGSSEYKHRIFSRLDKKNARTWAMSITPKAIDHLSLYTGINYTYSLSKLDQVAVPGEGGALANWGLVIYGESALLFNNSIQTNLNKQSIAGIISYKLSHQWFGNLVTCKWWSEAFLNAGFATMFQYYTTHYVLPDFEMEKQFVVRVVQPILVTDGYQDVPALRSSVSTPSEVSAKFDSYTYSKGGSILRMIEHIVGREYFKAGVQKYLADNAYQPVEPQDLWDALENVTENALINLPTSVTLSQVVDNWINKGGYPVLNVFLVGRTIVISQKRFLYKGADNEKSTWYVPVSFSTAAIGDNNELTSPKGWVTPNTDFVLTGFSNASDWIVVNNQQTGFYRVNYDTTLWSNLAAALKQTSFSGIHVSNRAQIVDDSYNLAVAGYLNFGQVLRIVEFLENENAYFTWYPAVNLFSYLLQKTGGTTKLGAALTNHFLKLTSGCAKTVPLSRVNEANHIFTLNQVLINTYACKYGNANCISAAKNLFAKYKTSHARPNINTRPIVYCNAIRYSDNPVEDWNFLYQQYQNKSVSQDASIIWTALGCATNKAVLISFLSKILDNDDVVTPSQYSSVFSTIYNGNEVGVDVALDYFIENYQAILNQYSVAGLSFGSVLIGLGSAFTRTEQINKLENFINTTTCLDATIIKAANSAISTATNNQNIISKHKRSLHVYFELSEDEETTLLSGSASSSTSVTSSTSTTSTPTSSSTTTITTITTTVVMQK